MPSSVASNLKVHKQPQQATLAVRVSGIPAPTPTSANEQYWAARALTAEALLSAQEGHYHELRTVTSEEDAKRIVSLVHTLFGSLIT